MMCIYFEAMCPLKSGGGPTYFSTDLLVKMYCGKGLVQSMRTFF